MKLGEKVWYCNRKDKPNARVAEYDAPVEITTRPNYFSVMPATARGYIAILEYGETVSKTWTATANRNFFEGKIKAGDLMWVDGEKPIKDFEESFGNGTTANAVVKEASVVNNTISIVLEVNQNRKIPINK